MTDKIDRFDFLEPPGTTGEKAKKSQGEAKLIKSKEDKKEKTSMLPTLAHYDFAGEGPRAGNDEDGRMYAQARFLKTRGERLVPLIARFSWALLRVILILALLIFFIWAWRGGFRIWVR